MRGPFRIAWLFLAACKLGAGSGFTFNNANVTGTRAATSAALRSTTSDTTSRPRTSAVTATCPSRTANYITHTLPQQCLRTDRAPSNGAQGLAQDVTAQEDVGFFDATSHIRLAESSVGSGQQDTKEGLTRTLEVHTLSEESPSRTLPPSSTTLVVSRTEDESDSPLDNANFLSFEEWKRQNLAKSGQSLDNIGQARNLDSKRARPGIDNALESFGDEGEIELDFAGFGGPAAPSHEVQQNAAVENAASGDLTPTLRSKDAGRTCKERTNYASFDCAATTLKTNPEAKLASSVLIESKDSYMLNPCSVKNKFFIVELCNDILVDTVVLANYEFFSSIFRHFKVSVSDRYPVKIEKWKDLGTFEARNTREVQAFLVERPQIWARYLRIEFLTHYGSEYYCPVSLLRVHGTTMLEDYRHQEEATRGDDTVEGSTIDVHPKGAIANPEEPDPVNREKDETSLPGSSPPAEQLRSTTRTDVNHAATGPGYDSGNATIQQSGGDVPTMEAVVTPDTAQSQLSNLTCAINHSSQGSVTSLAHGDKTSAATDNYHGSTTSKSKETATLQAKSPSEVQQAMKEPKAVSSPAASRLESAISEVPIHVTSEGFAKMAPSAVSQSVTTSSDTATPSAEPQDLVEALSSTTAESTRTASTASLTSSATQPQGSTQESFFKSVHKRLQQLESNSTLSLQYIEEQSRILRDAFSKVEKRQISTTSSFLSTLNHTVLTELHGFRQAYDQLWQSTVIELEGQREQYQSEMLALSSRLTLVADELVWQKRMGIVQSTLLLLCLALVLFARNGTRYLEMPLMQQMMNRSQAALGRSGWESPPASPSPKSRSPVSLLRRKLWRSLRDASNGDVTDGSDSRPQSKHGPKLHLEPPTPDSENGLSEAEAEEEGRGNDENSSDLFAEESEVGTEVFADVRESQSGPATPRGTRDGGLSGTAWIDPGASGDSPIDV